MSSSRQEEYDTEMSEVRDLLEHILESLVDDRESIEITMAAAQNNVIIEVQVNPADFGKVLGKSGKTANAIRTILGANISRMGKRFTFDVVDPKSYSR